LQKKNIENYLRSLSGFNKLIAKIDKYILKGFLLKQKYNKRQLLAIQNYIECEAHRELLIKGLKKKQKDVEK